MAAIAGYSAEFHSELSDCAPKQEINPNLIKASDKARISEKTILDSNRELQTEIAKLRKENGELRIQMEYQRLLNSQIMQQNRNLLQPTSKL